MQIKGIFGEDHRLKWGEGCCWQWCLGPHVYKAINVTLKYCFEAYLESG
jgi:hypothetical protein